MTKGVYGGKQKRKTKRDKAKTAPKTVDQKQQPESHTEGSSSAAKQPESEIYQTMKKPNRREKCWNWLNRRSSSLQVILPSVFSTLVLGAIIIQAVIYYKQWQAMQGTLAEMRTSRELENRAWIGMKS